MTRSRALKQTIRARAGKTGERYTNQLPEGVRTRQVTFYVDGGTPLCGKLFLPKGFAAEFFAKAFSPQ